MSTETVLLIVLIVLLAGGLPLWPHSQSWGYAPTGILTFTLIVFICWAVLGDRPLFRRSGNIEAAVSEAGENIKSTGRDVASSIRRAVE